MKKAIDLLIIYISFLIIGIITATFFYSAYLNIMNLIIGNKINVFEKTYLVKSIIFVSYCILIISCPVISYYRIRRPGGITQFIAYLVTVFITWFVLFPLVYQIEKSVSEILLKDVKVESEYLSPDYFRKADNKVYYFTKEFKSENNNVATSSAIVIDTSSNGSVEYKTIRDIDTIDYKRKALPFKDILVKQNFNDSIIMFPMNLQNLIDKLKKVMQFKLSYIFYYLSFVIVICTVYSLTNLLNWKMLNSCLLFFVSVAIICVNSNETVPIVNSVKSIILGTKLFSFLSQYIYESFLFVMNVLLSFILFVFGFITFIYHCKRKKEF